jgi:dihydroorotase
MIDPHVHLRDWNQKNKETVKHGLQVAYKAGLDGVFEMPNTDPAITSQELIEKRIELADKAINKLGIKIFHGLYAGITANPKQIEEVVKAHKKLFPKVVGLKFYAGQSTGNMGVVEEADQKLVYQTLAKLRYTGVLVVHCDKESLMKPELWNPQKPITHTLARPPEAEAESVKDQIRFAREAGFKGVLHVCHISVPQSLEIIEKARNEVDFKITCGVTPQHCLLYDELMNVETQNFASLLLKINPPLRSKQMQEYMLDALLNKRIDWIETDHSPHTIKDKTEKFASGFPGLPNYPHFIKFLRAKGLSEETIEDLTHNNIVKIFKINIANSKREGDYDLVEEYEFDVFDLTNK